MINYKHTILALIKLKNKMGILLFIINNFIDIFPYKYFNFLIFFFNHQIKMSKTLIKNKLY